VSVCKGIYLHDGQRRRGSWFLSLSHSLQFAQSPDDQKATFYAVWEAIDEFQKFSLISLLCNPAGTNENRYAKAERFSKTGYHLRYKASVEHDRNVSQLLDFLSDLSVLAVEQMIILTESDLCPPLLVDQQSAGQRE
jgi:hypothetical protein